MAKGRIVSHYEIIEEIGRGGRKESCGHSTRLSVLPYAGSFHLCNLTSNL